MHGATLTPVIGKRMAYLTKSVYFHTTGNWKTDACKTDSLPFSWQMISAPHSLAQSTQPFSVIGSLHSFL